MPAQTSPFTKTLLALAARSTGVRFNEVHGVLPRRASNALIYLAAKGLLLKFKEGHASRYFVAQETLDAYARTASAEREEAKRKAAKHDNTGTMLKPRSNASWRADTPAYVPPHVKVQVCPSGFSPRTQEVEVPFVHSGNQRGRIR
jgi:hypothetical protein